MYFSSERKGFYYSWVLFAKPCVPFFASKNGRASCDAALIVMQRWL